jgi:GNAT superfamily N-acetyltransferase
MAPTDIRVEPLTASRGKDYLAFFDHERGPAFADNQEWAKCYCHYYEVPPAVVWSTLDGPANRVAMTARIGSGEMEGFLAYAGGEVIGWCNAQPYHKLRHACTRLAIPAPPLPVAPHDAAAIVCFVIAPAWRRRGVATALLAGALANFAARGLTLVDAFPWNTAPDDKAPAAHYHGSMAMFIAAGFAPLATYQKVTVVRRLLR